MTKIQKMAGRWIARVLASDVRTALVRQEGQTLAEYAMILALIAVAVIAAVTFLSGQIGTIFSTIGSDI
jgi:Flp pilus assembly pilin Flp